jgi:DUF438 domain-containing protein
MNPDRKFLSLLKRISQHYFREAEIIRDLCDAKLSESDWEIVVDFVETHPYAALSKYIQAQASRTRSESKSWRVRGVD